MERIPKQNPNTLIVQYYYFYATTYSWANYMLKIPENTVFTRSGYPYVHVCQTAVTGRMISTSLLYIIYTSASKDVIAIYNKLCPAAP